MQDHGHPDVGWRAVVNLLPRQQALQLRHPMQFGFQVENIPDTNTMPAPVLQQVPAWHGTCVECKVSWTGTAPPE